MKLVITGGAGFIGKWVVSFLPDDVEAVIIDSLDPQVNKTGIFSDELLERAECIQADVREPEQYASALEGADCVLHLASQTGTGQSMYESSRYIDHNVIGTSKLLETLSRLDKQPRRIVLTSSRAVYGEGAFANGSGTVYPKGRRLEDLRRGIWEVCDENGTPLQPASMMETHAANPTSIYGLTKLWQEQLIENWCASQSVDYAILRLQNVFGPKQELHNPYTGIIGIFTNAIANDRTVDLFEDGLMTRDFVYVGDVASAIVSTLLHETPVRRIFNIGSGEPTTLQSLVEQIADAADKPARITYSGRFRVGDIRHAVADVSEARKFFGKWKPTPLAYGLREYLAWYLAQTPPEETALSRSLAEMERKGLLLTSATA